MAVSDLSAHNSPTQETHIKGALAQNQTHSLAPGMSVSVRDEEWLITATAPAEPGHQRITVRGTSGFVRDQVATFHTALDQITPFNPSDVRLVADTSPHYRLTRLWIESMLRKTPVSIFENRLYVADASLVDALPYQRDAVAKALNPSHLRPRLLIADAVGLGKTIEIGMILSELVKRGRGERILMVVPNHVLEQMQKEMWNRFSLPFVRLDTVGIQKVRQKLPATRNPFTYFNRAIISIDTLKQPKYRVQLEKVRWGAVVLDEAHNVTNTRTQNNDLARILAPNTDALILASATPHNGDPQSFAELIRLLDPTAVSPTGEVDPKELERLVVRRHRYSPEVDAVVGEKWAPRADPVLLKVDAGEEEAAVARALKVDMLEGAANRAQRLQAWTLIKAFLSSPAALQSSINNRIRTLQRHSSQTAPANDELAKLHRLLALAQAITPEHSQKFQALVRYLKDIGVGPRSQTRVVIFSERVDTLAWLQEHLSKALKLKPKQVATMDGKLADVEQLEIVERFKRAGDPLRVLITGDVASEGVNLHAQCHHLIHYDIPWSLIRIQQRNGRIDRYGQMHPPQIATMVLDTPEDATPGEVHVLSKLIQREYEATQMLNDVQSLMGEFSIKGEEDAIREVLAGKKLFDDTVRTPQQVLESADLIDAFFTLDTEDGIEDDTAQDEDAPPLQLSLYSSESAFVEDALMAAFDGRPEHSIAGGGVAWRKHPNGVCELEPPQDLLMRFDALPQDFAKQIAAAGKFSFVSSKDLGRQQLQQAQDAVDGHTWPLAHYLSPLHPLTEWAADRALSSLGRQEVPVIFGAVDSPTVLTLGTWTNVRGQTITRMFSAATQWWSEPLEDVVGWLHQAGIREGMSTVAVTQDRIEALQPVVEAAVKLTKQELEVPRSVAVAKAQHTIDAWKQRKSAWDDEAATLLETVSQKQLRERIEQDQRMLDQLMPAQSVVRPLVVLLPKDEA